jgi:transposase
MKFWQIWNHEIEYETEKTLLISCSNKLKKRRKRESARKGVEEEEVTFKSCAKGDGEVKMGCDGAAAEIGDGLD